MQKLAIVLLFSLISYTTKSIACLPEPVPEGTAPLTIEEAKAQIARLYPGVETKYLSMCKCGSESYGVRLSSDSGFKEIEVGWGKFMGSRLLNYVVALLKIPDDRVLALSMANKALEEDIAEVGAEFGVYIYDPNGSRLSHRFPDNEKQRLYVSMWTFELPWSGSSAGMLQNLLVNTSQFIPGRTHYEEGSIYKKGELRETFIKDPVFKELKARAIRNFNNREYQGYQYTQYDWREVAMRYIAADPAHEAKADLAQEPFFPPGKDVHDAIMNFFALNAHQWAGYGADFGPFEPEKLFEFLPEIPKALEPQQERFLIALQGLGFFNYRQGIAGKLNFAGFKESIEDYANLFARDPALMSRINFGSTYVKRHRWVGSVPTVKEFLQELEKQEANAAMGIIAEMSSIQEGSARDWQRDEEEARKLADKQLKARQAAEAELNETKAMKEDKPSFLPSGNEVHQALLRFFEGAAESPDWKAAGADLGPFDVQYSQFLPQISGKLQPFQAQFIQALNALGFFNYHQGQDGVFKFAAYKSHIENYARFFALYPDIMANVDPNSSNVRKYRLNGDVAMVWQLCEDLGLDHKQYPY